MPPRGWSALFQLFISEAFPKSGTLERRADHLAGIIRGRIDNTGIWCTVVEIEILFKEDQYDELKALQTAKTNGYWAIQLPEDTAAQQGKPLTWYFTGTCYIGMSEIAIDDMLKSKLTIYRSSEIKESKGFPTE